MAGPWDSYPTCSLPPPLSTPLLTPSPTQDGVGVSILCVLTPCTCVTKLIININGVCWFCNYLFEHHWWKEYFLCHYTGKRWTQSRLYQVKVLWMLVLCSLWCSFEFCLPKKTKTQNWTTCCFGLPGQPSWWWLMSCYMRWLEHRQECRDLWG